MTCTPACLSATTRPERCRCIGCGGRLHGTALDESIYTDALLNARRRGLHHLSDAEIVAGDHLETNMTRPLDPTEHAPACDRPGFEWQATIVPGLPRRGRCRGCGCVAIYRGTEVARRNRTRGGAA